MAFREELWNSELFATPGELAGASQGRGRRSDRVLSGSVQSEGDAPDKCGPISDMMGKINRIRWKISHAVMRFDKMRWDNPSERPPGFAYLRTNACVKCGTTPRARGSPPKKKRPVPRVHGIKISETHQTKMALKIIKNLYCMLVPN